MHSKFQYTLPIIWLLFGLLSLAQFNVCLASERRLAVVYPLVSKPYNTIFEQIIDGISSGDNVDIVEFGIETNKEDQSVSLKEWLAREEPDVVIALGRRGVEGIRNLELTIPTIFGGVLNVSADTMKVSTGISLTPDPGILFRQLKRLSPETRRVFVVYNPTRYQWLIDIAQVASKKLGISLVSQAAEGLRDSAQIHREFLRKANRKTDSVWLLQDSNIIGKNTILPMILEQSWNQKLLVFSSNPSDVPRGVLFSFYADNRALGKKLQTLAANTLNPSFSSEYPMVPLTTVLSAINIRTASHMNLQISNEEIRSFQLIFPRK